MENWRGWYNSPCSISCLYPDFPRTGEDKTSLHQAEQPDSKWQNGLEFTFPQLPDSSFTQMRSNRHSHQDISSHGPDKQGPRHTSWSCVSPSRRVLYLPGWSFLQTFLAPLGEVSSPAQAEPEAPVSVHSVQVKHGNPWADQQDKGIDLAENLSPWCKKKEKKKRTAGQTSAQLTVINS